MKKIKPSIVSIFLIFSLLSCQTIKQKTDAIVEKENKKLSAFIGMSSQDLKSSLGTPDEDFKNEKGNLVLTYNTKKYGIPCERRFEVNTKSIVIGFVSNGCF
jgi:hypothetical protein